MDGPEEGARKTVPGLPGSDPELSAGSPVDPPRPPEGGGDDDRWDEDPEHVPGSFLSSLPQFFVFPLILVATLTVVYLLLRMLAGFDEPTTAEYLAKIRSAPGPHARWQSLHGFANALREERLHLDDVPPEELTALYEALAPEGPMVRSYLLRVLAYKSDPTFARIAEVAVADEDPDVRMGALYALKQLGQPSSTMVLAEHLGSGAPWEERFVAIAALAEIGSQHARDVLYARLGDGDGLEHRNIVLSLALNGDPRAVDWLDPMLDRGSYAGDASLLAGLEATAEDSRQAAQANLIDQFLINSCRAAGALGDPGLGPRLQTLRRDDPSTKVQGAALNALHELGVDV